MVARRKILHTIPLGVKTTNLLTAISTAWEQTASKAREKTQLNLSSPCLKLKEGISRGRRGWRLRALNRG
jgi:hypothetical protein